MKGKKRKRIYHYFAKTPLSNSFNMKDLSTRSSHHNKSQFKNNRLEISTHMNEYNQQCERKAKLQNELTKIGGDYKYNQTHVLKQNTLEGLGSDVQLADTINNLNDDYYSYDPNKQRKSIKQIQEEKQEQELQNMRYNMTFRGSVKHDKHQLEGLKSKGYNKNNGHENDDDNDEESGNDNDDDNESNDDKSSSSNSDQSQQNSKASIQNEVRDKFGDNEKEYFDQNNNQNRKRQSSYSRLQKEKMKIQSQRLSMVPFLQSITDNSSQLKIKVKVKNNTESNNLNETNDSQQQSNFSKYAPKQRVKAVTSLAMNSHHNYVPLLIFSLYLLQNLSQSNKSQITFISIYYKIIFVILIQYKSIKQQQNLF